MKYALTLLTLAAGALAKPPVNPPANPPCLSPIKNFIYIVPDGYGPASQTMARDYLSLLRTGQEHIITEPLAADELVIGNVRTASDDSLITDSAASATAFACGYKTGNGVIALDAEGRPVASVLEAAKLEGLKTGLVVTSRITHATPAGYSAHVPDRDQEDIIAEQQIGYSHPLGSVVDILMGGGRCYYQPQEIEGSCRADDVNLLNWAEENGFHVVTDREGFDGLADKELPYLGLFTDSHMSYELDRNPAEEPALVEMVEQALTSLDKATKDSKKGYFLMIEASRIDHAGHASDAAGHLHETIMYNKVMDFVRSWIDDHTDTLMMSAADHECGGLTLNGFTPLGLKPASNTTETLEEDFNSYNGDNPAEYLRSTILPAYGVTDATDEEVQEVVEHKGKGDFANVLGAVGAKRAGVHWSTGDHTAVDVTLFGYGAECQGPKLKGDMAGHHDNTDMPGYIEERLGLDLKAATKELTKDGDSWIPKANPNKVKRDHHRH